MKTLKESILKSVKAGKYALIEDWCKKYNIYEGKFKINTQGEIEPTIGFPFLELKFEDYTELPKYIKFADHPYLGIVINTKQPNLDITSWEGLPTNADRFIIRGEIGSLPKITLNGLSLCTFAGCINNQKEIVDINFRKLQNHPNHHNELSLNKGFETFIKKFKFKNLSAIDVRSHFSETSIGNELLKQLGKDAPVNKSSYDKNAVTEKGVKKIYDLFKDINMSDVDTIFLGWLTTLKKENGIWYKRKA